MIGAGRLRSTVSGVVAVALVGGVFGQRSADPAVADPVLTRANQIALVERVGVVEAALDALERHVAAAVEAGRRGSARTVAGGAAPGPMMIEAGALVAAARSEASAVAAALDAVAGSPAVPDGPRVAPPTDPAELDAIGAQLVLAADAADEFARMRHRAEGAVEALDRALAAVTGDDPAASLERAAEARRHLEALAAWESGLVTLPIWLATTGELIDVVEALAWAMVEGDPSAAAAAGERFEAVVAGAREADVALSLAISEGGSAVAAPPLRSLAAILDRASATRAALASILHEAGAPAG